MRLLSVFRMAFATGRHGGCLFCYLCRLFRGSGVDSCLIFVESLTSGCFFSICLGTRGLGREGRPGPGDFSSAVVQGKRLGMRRRGMRYSFGHVCPGKTPGVPLCIFSCASCGV